MEQPPRPVNGINSKRETAAKRPASGEREPMYRPVDGSAAAVISTRPLRKLLN